LITLNQTDHLTDLPDDEPSAPEAPGV
jgi:hypothetical protein